MFPSHGLADTIGGCVEPPSWQQWQLLPDGDLDGLLLGVGQASIPERTKIAKP